MEEHVARHCGEREALFLWQVRPTVIFGRNQSLESEVDTAYCREHGIEMYRRKSGGGCVYADEHNLMISYVGEGDNVGFAFHTFVGMMVLLLRSLGVEAVATAHNDILIGDRKVSGTACYKLPGHCIVHATLLYDTRMQHMLHAITPPADKLRKKGIQSVRQRITLLKDHITLSFEQLKSYTREKLCSGELLLTPDDVGAIECLEQTYKDEQFINLIK